MHMACSRTCSLVAGRPVAGKLVNEAPLPWVTGPVTDGRGGISNSANSPAPWHEAESPRNVVVITAYVPTASFFNTTSTKHAAPHLPAGFTLVEAAWPVAPCSEITGEQRYKHDKKKSCSRRALSALVHQGCKHGVSESPSDNTASSRRGTACVRPGGGISSASEDSTSCT